MTKQEKIEQRLFELDREYCEFNCLYNNIQRGPFADSLASGRYLVNRDKALNKLNAYAKKHNLQHLLTKEKN